MRTVETTGLSHKDIIKVRLERGERTRLRVLEVPWMRPVTGLMVIADGVVHGPTDEYGAIWSELEPAQAGLVRTNEVFVELDLGSRPRAGTTGLVLFVARR